MEPQNQVTPSANKKPAMLTKLLFGVLAILLLLTLVFGWLYFTDQRLLSQEAISRSITAPQITNAQTEAVSSQLQQYLQTPFLTDATLNISGQVSNINGSTITISDGKNSFTQSIPATMPISSIKQSGGHYQTVTLSAANIHTGDTVVFHYTYSSNENIQLRAVSALAP